MTLSGKICTAIAGMLEANGVDSIVQPAITADANTQYENRVIVIPTGCTERQTLRGIYNVSGQVVVLQSIDEENAIATYLHLCNSVREILGDTDTVSDQIMAQDPTIQVYSRSFHLEDMEDDAGDRGYKATFSWRGVARDTPITN